ncbi:hypothetical protein Glove_46g12 [Diversispora epigaea]|uniref:Uncharacterized protein n=1 Tax=Diversispora epigaea TaxID=1348612 RepID=A0A397JNG7_9GLOM|nr:hypothetical protein Glove_46g12 [Diversispora epigaea]
MGKSRNNKHKTMGKFTDSPIQYMQLLNQNKYEHTIICISENAPSDAPIISFICNPDNQKIFIPMTSHVCWQSSSDDYQAGKIIYSMHNTDQLSDFFLAIE